MKQVIVFPRGQLNAKDRERLTKVGLVVVEADDPSKVVTLLPTVPLLSGDDIFMSAMHALVKGESYSNKGDMMLREMFRRAQANETARASQPKDAALPAAPAQGDTPNA